MKEVKTQKVLQVCLLLHGKEWQLMHCQSSASLLQIPDQGEMSGLNRWEEKNRMVNTGELVRKWQLAENWMV
jgi:hypothetical protein